MSRIVVVLLLLLVLVATAACAPAATPVATPAAGAPGAAKPAAGDKDVVMQNTAFDPKTVTAAVGSSVKWTNKDSVQHTATSKQQGVFDSGDMKQAGTFSFKFSQAGTFDYFCKYHPNMTGTITVQ